MEWIILIAVLVTAAFVWLLIPDRPTPPPARLCTNCGTIATPQKANSGRYFCPSCAAENPIALDSPVARVFLKQQEADSE